MYATNKSWFLGMTSIAVCFAMTACGSTVVGGGSGGAGGNTTTTVASSTGNGSGMGGQGGNGGSGTAGGNPGSSNAISMLYSELTPPDPAGGTTVGSTSGGGGPDPNTLYIAISDTIQNCNDPYAAEPCGNHYRVMLGIPPALQQVGIIALNDPTIFSHFSWAGVEDQPGTCAGGGGSFWDGELEITEIDATHVAGILTNTATFDFDANGPFDAPRCVF